MGDATGGFGTNAEGTIGLDSPETSLNISRK